MVYFGAHLMYSDVLIIIGLVSFNKCVFAAVTNMFGGRRKAEVWGGGNALPRPNVELRLHSSFAFSCPFMSSINANNITFAPPLCTTVCRNSRSCFFTLSTTLGLHLSIAAVRRVRCISCLFSVMTVQVRVFLRLLKTYLFARY